MSKKGSGTSAPHEPLVFFTDRDLGKSIPSILKSNGLVVKAYHEHFTSPRIADQDWIPEVASHRWVILTHDRSMRHESLVVEALMGARARVFVLIGQHPYPILADAFIKVAMRATKIALHAPGAFIAKVYAINPETSKAKPTIKMWLTESDWRKRRR